MDSMRTDVSISSSVRTISAGTRARVGDWSGFDAGRTGAIWIEPNRLIADWNCPGEASHQGRANASRRAGGGAGGASARALLNRQRKSFSTDIFFFTFLSFIHRREPILQDTVGVV